MLDDAALHERARTWLLGKPGNAILMVDSLTSEYIDLRDAARAEEFERLYQKVVNRISADIAGDFEAALDQLEYNARAEQRERDAKLIEATISLAEERIHGPLHPILRTMLDDAAAAIRAQEE